MPTPPASPPLELRTERLLLRSARAGDGPALHAAIADSLPDLFPWISFAKQLPDVERLERVSAEAAQRFAAGDFYVWRAFDPLGGELLGTLDLHTIVREVPKCELGFWMRSTHTGRGLATEAARAVLGVALEDLGALRVEARCDTRNERSWRLVERLGFAFEGVARNDDRDAAGELCSTRVYAFTHDEPDLA